MGEAKTTPGPLTPSEGAYRRLVTALALVGFVTFAVLYAAQPMLPLFAATFRLTPTAASLAVSAATLGVSLALPLWGALSDRVGRRRPLLAALLVSTFVLVVLAWAPDFPLLVAARFVQGAALAGVPSIAMAYLGEEVAPQALGRAMGLYIAGNSVGGMLGRVAVGALAGRFGWRLALSALGVAALLLVAAVVRLLPPRATSSRGAARPAPSSPTSPRSSAHRTSRCASPKASSSWPPSSPCTTT